MMQKKYQSAAERLGVYRLTLFLQRKAARSRPLVQLAVLVRNQCNMVIKYHFAMSPSFEDTGESWFLRKVSPHAQTFVDVGANDGDWTAANIAHGTNRKRFVAFEPGRSTCARLVDRFRDVPQVTILDQAVSDECGEASFYEHKHSWESTLAVDYQSSSNATANRVAITTLDRALHDLHLETVDFLKIDTEGYDLRVIQGAQTLLAGQHIGVIQFEYNDQWRFAGSTLSAAYQIFRKYDYAVFLLRYDGLYEFDYSKYKDFFGFSNFVAISARFRPILQAHVRGKI
jgi:FkbM family methyltransferase